MRRFVLAAVVCLAGNAFAGTVSGGPSAEPKAAGDFLFDTRSHIRLGMDDVTWTAAGLFGATSGGDTSDNRYNIYASMGYFVTDKVEIEGSAQAMREPIIEDRIAVSDDQQYVLSSTGDGFALGAGVNLYFREPVAFDGMYPYVGVGFASWLGDFEDKGTHLQAKVGIRQYFTDNLGLRFWVEYDLGDNMDGSDGYFTGYLGVFSMVH